MRAVSPIILGLAFLVLVSACSELTSSTCKQFNAASVDDQLAIITRLYNARHHTNYLYGYDSTASDAVISACFADPNRKLSDIPLEGPVVPYNFASVQHDGAASPSADVPAITADGTLELESGEEIVDYFEGRAKLCRAQGDGKLTEVWRTPAPSEVFITDRRVAFICRKFEKGSVWFGGAAGAALLTAASALKAVVKRHNKVAAGQMRFQWVTAVVLSDFRTAVRTVDCYIGVGCDDGGVGVRLDLHAPQNEAEETALQLSRRVAAYRLAHPFKQPIDDATRDALKQAVNHPQPEEKRFDGIGHQRLLIYSLPGARRVPLLE